MADAADEVKARLRARIAAIEAAPRNARGLRDASRRKPARDRGGEPPVYHEARASVLPAEGGFRAADAATDDAERAFRKIERLCAARERASEQLRRRLAREGFPAETADAAVGRALACGLVDDARFAEVLVRSRLAQGRGAQGIAAELDDLGIDLAVVPGWPDVFCVDHDSEVERALETLDRKPPRAKNQRDAAYRRLVQKGFGAAVASTAARVWSDANPD